MQLVKGNLWNSKADIKIFTSNAVVKTDGTLVMGRGAALEAREKYKDLDKRLGTYVKQFGPTTDDRKYGVVFDEITAIGAFQVKYHYQDKVRFDLIINSTQALKSIAESCPQVSYAMNFPGTGWGNLQNQRHQILKIIETLPNNVEVYEF